MATTNDEMSRAFLTIYPDDVETNVGALFQRYLADNDWLTWETWVAEVATETSIAYYGDAVYEYWAALP